MKKPTTFKPMNLILAMFTNLVLFAQRHFEKFISTIGDKKSNRLTSLNIKHVILTLFLFLSFVTANAQLGKAFAPRLSGGSVKVKGDVVLIGNTIVNRAGTAPIFSPSAPVNGVTYTGTVTNLATLTNEANTAFNANGNNNDYFIEYSDVDSDASTFSSTSANLLINNSCKKIVFAGLYWSAIYPYERSTNTGTKYDGSKRVEDWNNIKFKLPAGSYQDITADEVIFDGYNYTNVQNSFKDSPYVCFKDVTSLLQGLADADGTYTVANVRAARGKRNGGGAGGWSLVIVYESPTLSSKYISVFDGFAGVNPDAGTNYLPLIDFPISGFQTLPTGFPVNAKIGVGALEGDNQLTGDNFQIKANSLPAATAFTIISDAVNPSGNFFNATISNNGAHITNRNPSSTNTMGFDIDNVIVPNPLNSVVPNNETGATLRLTTSGDGYGAFVTTFAVDIIEPKITLTKEVFDYSTNPPTNVGGADVTLGRELNYVIGFQNQGNDNATNFTITDILPINTKFNYPSDIDIASLPPGTTHSYNAATRTILFTIPNNLVEVNDPRYTIRFKVKVVESCSEISDVCSNIIQNTALSNYSGTYNTGTFGDKSLASYTSCNIGIPQSTNFLVDVDDCKFEKSEILCGASIQISAANGYSSYSWSTSDTGIPVIGTGQTLTVVKEGVYYVQDTAPAPCLSIKEKVTVTLAGGLMENPVLPYAKSPYAGSVTICPDNGKELPNLFLCGANDFRDIKTGISGTGTTIVWDKLNESESSCAAVIAVTNDKCAIESSSCNWIPVATGPDYRADTKGQYRLTITYQNNCFNQFYFNVFKNELSPTETHTDIICTTNGNITINGVPAGYEYSLSVTGTYQDSNSFTITTPGVYTVYIKQKGVTTNPCIFQVSNITVRRRNFEVVATPIHPLCYGTKGSIKIAVNDVRGQYYYELFKGGTSLQKVGPVAAGDYTFNNLDSGDYSFTVKTDDGCTFTDYYEHINETAGEIIATAAITRPLTDCTTGIIKITTSQDRNYSNSFYYFINGSSTFQTSNEIEVTTAGTYTIRIVGTNNCEKTISIDVPKNPKPTYTVSHTNSNCYDDAAEIRINLTSATTGYTMGYSINGGGSYQTSPVFSNLQPGTYNVLVKYSVTYPISNWPYTETKDCLDPVQPITITGPTSAVTASAGVGELAGCGPLQGGQPTGLLRITNAQGGTAPYQYSFDGGATWQTSNEKYVVSSTVPYDLRVKDNVGCIYKIPYDVILDPKPEDPVIDSNVNPVFNCDGTATATVVVNTPTTSGATYTYEYYLKTGSGAPVPNTPITNNVFTNVPSGNHTVIVKYNITTVSTYSNLLQEDFGRGGDTTSPGINSAYCWEKQDGNTSAFIDCIAENGWHSWLLNDGEYVVTKGLLADHGPDFNWILPKDHTAVLNNTPAITDGRFLAVNIGKAIPLGAVLYSKTINDVIPNQDIKVSLYMLNLLKATNGLDSPQLTIQLVKGTTVIASQVMPSIPRDEQWHSSTDLAGVLLTLNPGNNTSLDFQIISNSQVIDGNDLAVDDILVYQIPKACGNEKEFPIVIDSNGAFNAPTPSIQDVKCSGSTDGSITITATNFNTTTGFYYSVNNGSTWNTSTTSPVIVSGLGAGIYKVIVKNDSAGTCQFSFDSEIKAPQAILIVTVDQTAPTCTTGGTITVTTVTGGTGSYQYQLSDGSGIVRAFQSSKVFTNIPQGNYTVQVKDANDCLSPASAPVTITTPTGPTATLAAATDWCYTVANPASLVVTVTGGLAPYTYKLDSNTPINTNTFNNVAPGTHTILVTDTNNCTTTISNIIIESQLQLNATLTQDLTCLVNASITTAVTGGYGAPYTYTVSYNGGAATAVASFPYTATLAGNYVFTVRDSKGCPATSNTVVVSPKTTPTLTTVKTDITCNNANNGTITVTAANGATTTYTYAIKLSSSASYTTQATNQFTGLSAGTYNIKVIDSKGCESAVSNVTIANPVSVTGTISATELGCSNTGTVPAVVTVTASGGTGSYQYSFNGTTNFTSNNKYSTSSAGTITAYIKDANGCQIGPLSVVINPKSSITGIDVFFDTGLECPAYEAHIKFQAIGGLSPIDYQIISGPAGYSSTVVQDAEFKNLKPGNYIFRATDRNGCSFDLNYNVKDVPDIVAGGSILTPIKCFGDKGTIQFTVNGVKDRGYDYAITDANGKSIQSENNVRETITTINVATPQPAGVYTITAIDRKTTCRAVYSITLTQPSAALSISSAVPTAINCNNDNSQITVTAAGGTPNYTYAFAKSPSTVPSSAYGNSAVLTVDTNSGADLDWDVYVKDVNGCLAKTTVKINSDLTPSVTASVTNQCTASGSTFTITAVGTGGTGALTYGIGGVTGAFQSSPTFTVAPGTYTVLVKDANGCSNPASPVTVYPQLTASAAVTRELSCSATTPQAQITVTASGGRTTYTYEVSTNGGTSYTAMATNVYTAATAGTYTFRVTDSNTPGCTVITSATVNAISNPTVTAAQVNVSCAGNTNGSVTLTGAGGSGGYTYSNNATGGFTTTATFTGLAAGSYTFYVKDSKDCTGPVNVTITGPTALTATASATSFSCNATNTKQAALVTIDVPTTGTAPYTYSFNGGAFTSSYTLSVIDNGTDQTINYTVKDNNGCTYPGSVVINRLNAPVISGITHTDIYCTPASSTTSTVTVAKTAGTGVGTITYEITAPPASATSNNTGFFTGLAGGVTYSFKVTDANGCFATGSHTVPVVNPIAAIATKLNDVYCNGEATGSIRYNVSQFVSTYSYKVNTDAAVTGQTAAVFTLPNLGVGTYDVVFTDETTGCQFPTSITITQPTVLSATIAQVNANCNVVTSKVTVTATDGTPGYTYAYKQDGVAPLASDYVASNSADLNPATNTQWDVWVKDANGCTFPLDVTITTDPVPSVTASVTNQCTASGSTFSITAVGTGGTGALTYGIGGATGAFQSSPTFTVAPGTYTVLVKDANGCTNPASPVTVYPQMTANAAVTRELSCSATTPQAQITVTASGGRTTYTYEVSTNGGTSYSAMATNVYTAATAGTYTFRVTDSNTPGCTVITSATVNAISNPTVTATQVNVSCAGNTNGSVTLTGAGGSGGYTYSNNATSGFTTTATFTGLAAGSYTFYVKDSKDCTGPVNVTITGPTALTATASATSFSCNATNTKQAALVTINVPTTGTAPYTYSFNGGAFTSSNTLSVNDNGTDQTINYTVKDNNGCTYPGSVVINRLNTPVISGITHTDIYCIPASSTTSTVTVAKTAGTGVGTITYEITAPLASATSNNTGIFTGLAGGVTYSFKVTDANGCFATGSHTVPVVNPIAAIATKLNDVYCNGEATGSIRYNVSQFVSTYSYKVNTDAAVTGQTAAVFTLPNLGVGTYDVVFTDETTGCQFPTSITITQPTVLSATIAQVNANCNVVTSKVTVTATDGTPGYTYAYKQDGVAPLASDYVASNSADLNPTTNTQWDVWVKDANGCTFPLDVTITTDLAPASVTATGAGCLGTVGGYAITSATTGGTGTLSYSINAGASYQASNVFPITSAGTYTIRVKDANGCTADSNPVIVAPQLTLSAVLNKDITCNLVPTDAQITLTPTGGAGPFTYTSSPNTGSFAGNVFTTSTPGNYTFTVTDNNSCSASTTTAIVVTPTVNPDITGVSQTQSINCNGDDTAAINITIDNTKGLAPFVFNVLNTTTGTDYGTQTSGLAAGNYTITVTDAKGCTDTFPYVINEPTPIIFTKSTTPITCAGGGVSLGSITINSVSGGTPNYIYHLTGVNGYDVKFTNQTGLSAVFDVVDFGLYQLIITDANGCSAFEKDILIASPPDDLDITVSAAPAVCSGPGSAVVAVGSSPTSTIGTGPFYFSLYTGSAPSYPTGTWLAEDALGSKQTTFTNLIPGVTYTFVVYDADAAHGGTGTGCYYYETSQFPIGTSSTITVNPLVANNITCKGAADGNVTFTINHTYGVATPVTYQIYNSQSVTPVGGSVSTTVPAGGSLAVNNFGSLPFGNYFVLITEDAGATNAGCSATSAPFAITESAIDLSITATKIKNVNCNEDGVIAAQAKDGTAPYTYQYLLASAAAPTAATAGWISNTTFATSTTGNYIVYVKDAYGCIKNAPVTLDADDTPVINAPAAPICYDGNAFTITFSGTVDPDIIGGATYSVNGSAFQTSPSFTFNASGTYNLVIKDGNGCTENVDYEVYPKLNLSASLTKGLDCTVAPDAIITLTTTGGNTNPAANYTYEVSFNSAPFIAAINPYTATTAGNYVFRVTDENNATVCQTTTSFDLDPITPTVFTTTETNVSCNGDTDGTITVNVSSGVGPYEYQLDAGAFQTSNVFTGLAAGTTYTITVKDAKSCLYAKTPITITEPAILAATANVVPFGCNSGNVPQSAVVTVTVTLGTGTGPYTYSFNGSTTYTTANTLVVADNGTDQTITYSVKDANGCIFNSSTTVDKYLPLTDITFALTTAPVCPTNVADVTLTVVGGYTPMAKYEIISPITLDNGNAPLFTGLATNETYLFKVTDANGCSIERNYTVDPVTPIAIVGAMINDISCNAADGTTNNGSAQFTVSGFSASGNYSIAVTSLPAALPFTQNASGDVITLTGLSAGTYTVTVQDNTTNCSESADVTITAPNPIAFTAGGTKVFCSQDISNITVSAVIGGTGPYAYAVVTGGSAAPAASAYTNIATLSVDTNLTDLIWDVYVKDANGCIHMQSVNITRNAAPTINPPAQQCYVGSPLTVDLDALTTVYGGVKTYIVNGSTLASSTATFTAPGTYKLVIKDDNECEDFVDYTIEKQLLATATLTKDLYCAAPVDATIDVAITDGVAPYTYQMYLDGVATGLSTAIAGSFTLPVTTAGSYTFVITDSNAASCSVTTNAVDVTTPATPTATAVPTAVICNGESNGTITVTPSNGVAPYTYVLSGTGANTTGDATGIYTGLIAGTTYSVVVTDAKGCPSAAIPVTITEPAILGATNNVISFGCDTTNAPKDAIVTITAGGGTGPYTYSFDNGTTFQTSASFSVNTAQIIDYVVNDANGCSIAGKATVNPYLPPTDMDLTASPIYCNTPGTVATITVNSVAGGAAPYTYEIISPAAAVTAPSATNSFTNLTPETYTIKVTDSNGCSTTKAIIVEEADKIAVTAQLINDVYCNGDDTGSVDFTVSNYITAGNYTFGLTPATGTFTQSGDVIRYSGLTAGNYTFTVTDGVSGCSDDVVNFTVGQPGALSSTSIATKINCNNDNATITVTPSGGTAPYRYAVVKTGSLAPTSFVTNNQLVIDTNNGVDVNWTVYVVDNNNCPANNPQPIDLDANPIITTAVPTQCPSATGTYDITVTATGFNTALLYSVDGVSYDTNNVITVNAPGVYNVTVKDANGCVSPATPVTIREPLILTPTVTSSPSCTDGDGVVAVATTGGSGNYEYKIDNGTYGAITPFAGVASGSHTIYVHDITTGCEMSTIIDLKPATQITGFALTPTHVTCNGGNDGTITATMATPAVGVNDNPVYVYSLNGGTPQDSPVFSGLIAGTYTVEVISERGCRMPATIEITQPNPVLVNNVPVSQFICTTGNTSNFATITVDPVTGGTGTYTYEFIKTGNLVPVQTGTSNTYTEYDLSGGSYTVNVYDSNHCLGTYAAPITIDPYIGLDKINVINTAITCTNLEDITATAVDASGTTIAGIQYTLTDVSGAVSFPSNTTGNFTGLPVGQYIITALNPITGCSIQKAHYVNEPNTFDLNVVKTSDVVCYGSNEGAVSITLIDNVTNPDDAGAFTYTVSGPVPSSGSFATAGPLNLSGLTAGQYTVSATLSNSPFCPVSTTFTISQPDAALSISETHNAITCISGNNDGSISVTATGGWAGGYEYQLENSTGIVSAWSATHDYPNLTAETYTVRVRDTKGCPVSTNVQLVIPKPIVVTASPNVSIVLCNGDTSATITATSVTGGQETNYSYTLNRITTTEVISSGPQVSPSFSGLGAGTYSITVTDGFNCSGVSANITITEPTLVTPTLVQSGNATCYTQASLTLSATGGTEPYTYSADANFSTVLGSFTATIPATILNVTPGDYQYYVKDANGCVSFVSNGITVPQQPVLGIEIDVLNAVINCKGDATGVIVAKATGGLGNYIYTLLDNNGTVQGPKADGNFTDLPAGTYTVHVDSGVDCKEDSLPVTISEPTAILASTHNVTNVTCNGNNDGKIVITATGGTGTIMYAISPNLNQFFDTNEFDNLAPGTYQVVVQDVLGCFHTIDFTITQPTSLTTALVPDSLWPEQCKGEKNGAFKIEIKGATAPYSVSLDNKNGTYVVIDGTYDNVTGVQYPFVDLAGGKHVVYIKDAASCTYELEVIVPDGVVLNPTAEINYDCVNNASANFVTITVDASITNPADVEYSLDGTLYQASNIFPNVAPGEHFVIARHTNACEARVDFEIVAVQKLTLTLSAGQPEMNVISVTAAGGAPAYEYSFNGEPFTSSNTYKIYKSGDYEVIVRDQNGCTATIIVPMIYVDVCIPNYFTPNGDGLYDGWGPGCTNIYNNLEFSIFDRYGRIIAKYHYGEKWDGKYNGEELPTGDYWYVLKLNDAKDAREFVGHFTLYR